MFEYSLYFRWLLHEIAQGSIRSMLLGAIPYTPASNLLFHPLIFPLAFSLKSLSEVPRILILNLDGRETVFNLRGLRLLP